MEAKKKIQPRQQLRLAVQFLTSIGLLCHWEAKAADFLEGVRIQGGDLYIDPAVHVSNVLHEAWKQKL